MSLLKVSEAFCYICRGVLIEPVTAPCLHVFCYNCFEQSMQETSYSCPLCRKRISNWVRTAKKYNKLINTELWNRIKEQFKEQVRLKLNGEDDGLDEHLQKEFPNSMTVPKPGEVAQEFSNLINNIRDERQRVIQAEELASKALIIKLKEEEEKQLESIQEINNLIIKKDEELARKIQEEINKDIPSTSKDNFKGADDKGKKPTKGPMDDFLKGFFEFKKRSEQKVDKRCTSADSTDSIQSELHHFRPIKVVPRTPPKQYPDGRIREIGLTKVTPLKLTFNNLDPSSSGKTSIESKKIHSPYSAFIGKTLPSRTFSDNYVSPPKRLRFSSDEPDNGVLKEITLGENSDSNSTSAVAQEDTVKMKSFSMKKSAQENFILPSSKKYEMDSSIRVSEDGENDNFETQDYLNPEPSIEDKLIEEQRRIEQIILQEKADRELALKLSREWESARELRTKPLTRSRLAAGTKSTNNLKNKNKKTQQTLIESIASRTRNRNK